VAHSHGGTVAVEALQRQPQLAAQGVGGLLTLATPFLSLHRPPGAEWERKIQTVIARFAPYMAIAVGVAAWASTDRSAQLSYLAAFARLVIMFVVLLIVLNSLDLLPWFPMPGRRLVRQVLDDPLPPLAAKVPLFAIRAPRDEATLAIVPAQIVGALSDALWRALIYAPLAGLRRKPAAILLALFTLVGLFVWYGLRETAQMQGLERTFVVALYVSFLFWAAFTLPVLLAFVILLPASAALALATGAEVMAFPGVVTVDAEALPSGSVGRELLILDLPDSDRERLLMRHSIYALATARQQVAAWITAQTAGASASAC
jgi:hypothetical protein